MKKIIITISTLFFLILLSSCANIINDVPKTELSYADENFEAINNLPDNMVNNIINDSIRDFTDKGKARQVVVEEKHVDQNKVVVKTDFGQVQVDINPRRILTLFNEATETAVALGFSPIGYVDSIESKDKEVWHDFMLENGMDPNLPVLGDMDYLDIDAIRELQPDLILASYDIHGKYFEELNEIAPTVFTNNSTSAFNENFLLFSEALGKKDEAEELLIDYYLFARDLETRYSKYTQQFVSVVQIEGETVYTLLDTTFAVEVLKEAGLLFFITITGTQEKAETNIHTLNGDIFFVSVSGDRYQVGNEKLDEFVEAKNSLGSDVEIYEVPYGIWDSTNGYLCAREILEEINSLVSNEVVTKNKYEIKKLK